MLVDKVVQLSAILDPERQSKKDKNEVMRFMRQSHAFDDEFRGRIIRYLNFRAASNSVGAATSFNEADERFKWLSPTLLAELRCRIFRPYDSHKVNRHPV